MTETYRVVAWSTGNVGRHVIAGIDARPDLELVGVWVSNPEKVGKDAGELAGLGRELGVAATNDEKALLALRPDVVVHSAMADHRLIEAMADIERILRSGVNVISSGPVFLQYPFGVVDDSMFEPVLSAALDSGVSLLVNGVDPGFANDALPLVLSGISERIEQVRVSEILNYNTYNQPMVLFDIMGFGRPLDEVPMILQPGRPHHGLGQRGATAGRGTRRRARRSRGVVRTAPGRPKPSTSTQGRSTRAPRQDCTSRCGACETAGR